MNSKPLRYNISSWRQLPQCLSNNSRYLHIHTADLMNNYEINGFKISVDHDKYGTLFCCVLSCTGSIITPDPDSSQISEKFGKDLTISEILQELEKFGFLVTYDKRRHLVGDQLQYLMTLKDLKFDKIRMLPVWQTEHGAMQVSTRLVGFQESYHENWLNYGYSPSRSEYLQGLIDGTALDITEFSESHKYDWSWLDYVANIDDILRDNAGDGINVG